MPDGSNQGETTAKASVAADQLRNIVERVERLNEEIEVLQKDKAEVFAECKAYGYDTKAVKIVVKRRAMAAEEREALDAFVDLYSSALDDL